MSNDDKPLDGSDVTDPELRRQVVAARRAVAFLDGLRGVIVEATQRPDE